MYEALTLLIALSTGLLFKRLGQPALIGYLLSGFILYQLDFKQGELIKGLAHVGEILLLFTIGLKLRLKDLAKPYVLNTTIIHMLVMILFFYCLIRWVCTWLPALPSLNAYGAWFLAFALSFSSTVFAVKVFDLKGESSALYASITIGILVVQDIIAVSFMSASTGQLPNYYLMAALILIPLRPIINRLIELCGHGELLILAGFTLALGSAAFFEKSGMQGSLGAILMGCYLGNSTKSKELYQSLIGFKDLFLVGFFLNIGLYGLPTKPTLIFALLLVVVLLIKPFIYFALFVVMRLRARTALLSSIALTNYSEFGLIVMSLAVNQGLVDPMWLVMMAVALSFSFIIASPINKYVHSIYAKLSYFLQKFERRERLIIEKPTDIGSAEVIILGMGRVGLGVYEYLKKSDFHNRIIGVEENKEKVWLLQNQGFCVIQGDGNDGDFWRYININNVKLIMVNLSNYSENLSAVSMIKAQGFEGDVAVMVRFEDQAEIFNNKGCITFNLYAEAGYGFAKHVVSLKNKLKKV